MLLAFHDDPGLRSFALGNIREVTKATPRAGSTAPFAVLRGRTRPLTTTAHEIGHLMGAPHAGTQCDTAADGINEPWRDDDRGRLQGTKFDASKPLPVDPVVDGVTEMYDLMSYCSGDTSDTDAADGPNWVSAYLWNRISRELLALHARVGSAMLFPSTRAYAAAADEQQAVAVGNVADGTGSIDRVIEATPPPNVAGSPVRLRSLAADGVVLLDAGATLEQAATDGDSASRTVTGAVAPNAASRRTRRGRRGARPPREAGRRERSYTEADTLDPGAGRPRPPRPLAERRGGTA